ncbi:hypothetical protein QM012_002976 [Aureobasidium pullulans]|uniref:Altered inheritance of mitochondria protein 9, mitochondrial n=1 Tax=Aureobasidium pullulans TaxID=5580 RepID=A0ABR0T8X9_AURPU
MSLIVTALCWSKNGSRNLTRLSTQLRQVSRVLGPDLEIKEDLFNFTRGRFVCNEQYETSQRHVRFNVNELARRAAHAIGASKCIKIAKYPDGMYNKSMLLTMDDGSQVVTKVPNPTAGLPHYTTASEVATMDFVKNVIKTPVPKVLAWCSNAQNPVGAEYIIMEKVPGIELECVWPNMEIKDRLTVVKCIAQFQQAWTSISFTRYGSLYYSKDLEDAHVDGQALYFDAKGNHIVDEKFAIGPSTSRENFDHGRATIEFDRGPWRFLEAYHAAIAHREIACVSQMFQLPKSPISLRGPGTYVPTRAKKLKALHCYLDLIKFLLPADRTISTPHLWHNDLHVANIFVDPSEPTKVVSLIDWQSTHISPLYFQARQPQIIDHDGPSMVGLERPQPPENLDELDPIARKHAQSLYLHQALVSLYNTLTHRRNPRLFAALQFQHTEKYLLLLLARNLLIDGEASYLLQIAELESCWQDFSTEKPYPFFFSREEREQLLSDIEGFNRGTQAMQSIKHALGDLFPEKGVVRPDQYDEAINALEQMKEQIIEIFATSEGDKEVWEEMWPFGR